MHTDNLVRVLYQLDLDIAGAKVSVYECGEPSWGDGDGDAFIETFTNFTSLKNVFYEAYLSGSKKPFHSFKTPPSNDELLFQLQKSQKKLLPLLIGLISDCFR